MRIDTFSWMSGGVTALTADGTPLAISAYNDTAVGIPCHSIAFAACCENAANIFVGMTSTALASTNGFPIPPSGTFVVDIDNANKISACGTNNDGLHYMILIK